MHGDTVEEFEVHGSFSSGRQVYGRWAEVLTYRANLVELDGDYVLIDILERPNLRPEAMR